MTKRCGQSLVEIFAGFYYILSTCISVMFAVPGWSVSAATLKTQVEPYKEDPPRLSKSDVSDDSDSTTKSLKKRKRGADHVNGVKITGDNVAELWEKHIEGKGWAKADGEEHESKSAKRRRKRGKREGTAGKEVSTNGMVLQGAEAEDEEEATAKNVKERKRRKKVPSLADGHPSATKKIHENALKNWTLNLSDTQNSSSAVDIQSPTLTPLQHAMREKLVSSRFRYLNQTLYTTPSTSSYELFTQNPTFFTEYHEGFRRQVSVWPENPVDGFIKWIEMRGSHGNRVSLGSQKAQFKKKKKGKKGKDDPQEGQMPEPFKMKNVHPLPRDSRSGLCTIADLGCGDAKFAQHFASSTDQKPNGPVLVKPLNLRIYSFDLAALTPLITVADIRSLPLPDSSVDVTIFCLALMGTNWIEFIEEAWRILRWKGECWIGEVGSRFTSPGFKRVEHSVGNNSKIKAKEKRSKGRAGHGEDGLEEEILVEDEKQASSALAQSSTNISAFVEVLHRRGFVLAGEPELGNKMFVRMRFAKASTPVSGKCVPAQRDAGGQTWGKKKFMDRESDGDDVFNPDMEARVLKPCVYKTR